MKIYMVKGHTKWPRMFIGDLNTRVSLTNRINRLVLEHTHNYMEQNDNVPHCAFGSG